MYYESSIQVVSIFSTKNKTYMIVRALKKLVEYKKVEVAYFNNLAGQVAYFDNLAEVTGLFRQFSAKFRILQNSYQASKRFNVSKSNIKLSRSPSSMRS